MKQLIAILFCGLLVWTPFAPAQASPVCAIPAMKCCGKCCHMACCAAKKSSDSQSAPAAPSQTSAQNQISLLAPGGVAWTLPENPGKFVSYVAAPALAAPGIPLYSRNCVRLL